MSSGSGARDMEGGRNGVVVPQYTQRPARAGFGATLNGGQENPAPDRPPQGM